ncbi:thioesterase family protein, partial [Alphaproteobacteria bacterium]|nr:thioesterase family protein [Alphaproteobacteria bacterium]
FCPDNKNVSAYFEMTISLNISEKIKEVINKIFTSNNTTYLNELEFKNLRLLEGNRPTKKIDNTAFMTCKKAVNTWDLDYSQMGSSQFKVGCVSDAATHLFTYCGADYNWRSKYNIGSAALDYSVRYYKTAPLGMAVTMYTNFTKIGNKSLKFIHHMIDDTSGELVMDIEIVAVLFDLEKRKSMEVPYDFRKKAERILLTN